MSSSKRPRKSRDASSDSTSSESSLKRLRTENSRSPSPHSRFANGPIKVFLIQAKLDPETVDDLFTIIENSARDLRRKTRARNSDSSHLLSFEICSEVADADILITEIRMKKRLERHVPWDIAQQKAIVTTQWLRDSAAKHEPMPCGDYAALHELEEETAHNCPESSQCSDWSNQTQPTSQADHPPDVDFPLSPPKTPPPPYSVHVDPDPSENQLSYKARYACQRATPLVCTNQGLATELDVLRKQRELEGEHVNALAYERAVAVIKAFPEPITANNLGEMSEVSGIGKKTLSKIEEYITAGTIAESQKTLASSRFQALSTFNTVYGIGPVTARQLYDKGLRTLEHLVTYYDANLTTIAGAANPDDSNVTASMKTNGAPDMTIKVGLALREDFSRTIPRAEVEEMHRVVMTELEMLQPGCISTIVGGYRRGKPESNDVDIIISHPDQKEGKQKIKGLCTKLVRHLYSKGLVTHVMHLSSFHEHNALRTGHWDSLEKALTVFVLPEQKPRIHRRLDLIFASPEAYWTAVTGWTGSKMFERDLRLWAKEKKYVA
ncbi:hypothetical protein HGRIS_002061 [Hohenbuehelia grisea]|uniref:DNA-directed DNA polymerase n=1 Tax=Hohenbuehelia grisea TaxID=104357 RepID=A0ABR3JJB4_9AGAR